MWDRDYEKLLPHSKGKEKEKKSLGSGAAPTSIELDNNIFEWFLEERVNGRVVTNYMLQAKARENAAQLRINGFLASNGWLNRWKKRFSVGIRRGTNDTQKLPSDYREKIAAFRDTITVLREKWDYTDFNIANMDQTMVRFDNVPNSTNAMIGEKTVRITNTGGSKKGCTVALSAMASGHKLPAFIIFKEKTGDFGPKVLPTLTIPKNVRISATKNGWMTTSEVHKWIRRVWGPNKDDVRRLLVLDSYRPHTCPDSLDMFETNETGGCTGLCQPMDTHVNKVFKQRMKQQWMEWFQGVKTNARGNFIQPTRQNVINWVSQAWSDVEDTTIIGAFKSCAISNSLSGKEDFMISRRLREEVGISTRDCNMSDDEDIDGTRAHGILFDSDESDDESLVFGGFDHQD